MRVVTTTCSNTEIVCALGCAELLVGVDEHSDFPPEVVGRLPRVGPDLGVDPAKVAALEPDLVLASLTVPGHEQVVASLEEAGLRVFAPEPTSIDDVYGDVEAIAGLLGVAERAGAVVEAMREALTPDPNLADAERPRILVEWWPKPVIVPGKRSWVTQMIAAAGGTNPMGERDVKSAPITDAEAVAMAPDAVVISWCGVKPAKYRPDVVTRREAWAETPALRAGRVHCVPEAYLGRPSPRLVDGVRALREVVEACRTDAPAREVRRP